jgi:AMP-binding enzyme C-terminal domain
MPKHSPPGMRGLVAYVIPNSEPVDPKEIQDFVASQLPRYMVPKQVICVEALPLTPNGKVDHSALPLWLIRISGPVCVVHATTWNLRYLTCGRWRLGVRT